MPGSLSPSAKQYFWNNTTGEPLAGGLVYTVSAGGSFPGDAIPTYNDADLDPMHANTNPIVLNSAGYCVIYLATAVAYKFIVKDANGVLVWTQDNVSTTSLLGAVVDVAGIAGEPLGKQGAVFLGDGTGGTNAGQWYHTTATFAFSSSTAGIVGMTLGDIATGTTGTIRLSGQMDITYRTLDVGAKYYVATGNGLLTTDILAASRFIGQADGLNSIILAPNPSPTVESVDIGGVAGVDLGAQWAVYLSAGDGALTAGRWYPANAAAAYASSDAGIVGLTLNAISTGSTGAIRLIGQMPYSLQTLTPGAKYYVDTTGGASGLTSTAPGNSRFVGQADMVNSIILAPN